MPDHGILLHIGPHKTGTTAIQGALAAAREQLMEAGIYYPGAAIGHNRASAAAIGRVQGMWGQKTTVDRAVWLRFVEQVRAHPGRTVISSEVFCEASVDDARRLVDELDSELVTVVATLRPLERLLASNWQQYIKSGYSITYEEWLEDVLQSRDRRPITPSFWLRQDHSALLRRWCEAVGGPERVCVVVVNPSRPRTLFNSFEDLLQLPRSSLKADKSSPRNRSLSLPEAEFLRQLNSQVRENTGYQDYARYIKRGAVQHLIENRQPADGEARITTPAWAARRAREYSRSDVAEIAKLGVSVIGDLDDLSPTEPLSPVQSIGVVEVAPIGLATTFTVGLVKAVNNVAEARRRKDAGAVLVGPVPPTIGNRIDRAVHGVRWRVRRLRRRHNRGSIS